jgi:lysophospholipase L1-like esterase
LLGEVLVLLVFGEQVKFPRHVVAAPWGVRYNDPHSAYRHQSADGTWHFRINGQGMRDEREFAKTKPAGTKRILSLGDSFTIGYEVHAHETFSAVLEHELRASGRAVEVLNAGVSGFSNAEQCLYLERELLDYQPDMVVVSFFGNDLVDNVRTGLFRFEGEQLVPWHDRYVPAGRFADWMNRNWFINLLSERSNLFVFAKERITLLVKRDMVTANERNLATAEAGALDAEKRNQQRLAAAIFERMYRALHARKIPMVIHSICTQFGPPAAPLQELFPLAEFAVDRPGIRFVASKQVLDPLVGKELLYHQRSHFHWTPLAHAVAGKALARAVADALP